MHHIPRFADAFQNGCCLRVAEIGKAGLRQQDFQGIPIAGLQSLPDGRRADGFAVDFFAGHYDAVDARSHNGSPFSGSSSVCKGKQAVQTLRRNALDSGKCANGVQPLSYIKKERQILRFDVQNLVHLQGLEPWAH